MLRHLLAGVLGGAVAVASVVVHRMSALGLPLGLLLALAGSLTPAWWLHGSHRPRLAASYAGGWLVLFALVVRARPEGDYLLASDASGYALMASSLVLVGLAVSALAAGNHR